MAGMAWDGARTPGYGGRGFRLYGNHEDLIQKVALSWDILLQYAGNSRPGKVQYSGMYRGKS